MGCNPPHAKIWEQAAAFLSYLEASRRKQEQHTADLVQEAARVFPANLDLWLSPSGPYKGTLVEEKWGTHPDNNLGRRPATPRMYTVQDSKKHRTPAALSLGKDVLAELKKYSEFFASVVARLRAARGGCGVARK